MVCVPCVMWPILLFIWYKFIHPVFLKFWNTKPISANETSSTSERNEDKKFISKVESEKAFLNEETLKKEE